jgi:hypothetical protein
MVYQPLWLGLCYGLSLNFGQDVLSFSLPARIVLS